MKKSVEAAVEVAMRRDDDGLGSDKKCDEKFIIIVARVEGW